MALSDIAAERGVLASIMHQGYPAYMEAKTLGITPDTMHDTASQAVMAVFEKLLEDTPGGVVDVPTIFSAATSMGLDSLLGKDGLLYLRSLRNFPADQSNVRPLAAKVKRLEIARSLDAQLESAQRALEGITGDEPLAEILGLAEHRILDFAASIDSISEGSRPMHDGARAYIMGLMDAPRDRAGMSTGFSRWDEAIGGGVRPNSVDIVGARLKTGKTFMVDAVADHVSGTLGNPCFNIDTEMLQEEHLHRVIARMSGVSIRNVETGQAGLDRLKREKVENALGRLERMPYEYECVAGKGGDAILSSIRRWLFRKVGFDSNGYAKPCLVLYDYLKLTDASSIKHNIAEYQALGFIMTALKNLMARYRVGCMAWVQLNREGIDNDSSSSFAGSDRIGWLATSLTILRKKTPEEVAVAPSPDGKRYTHLLRPIDCRHGPGLDEGDYINVHTDYAHGRMEEGTRHHESQGAPRVGGFVVEEDGDVEFGEAA